MPKVKNPLLSIEARGGIGGLVFNTWRGINYVKTNTSPTGQGTPKRLVAQGIVFITSKLWQTATDPNRIAWNEYAVDHPVTDWTGSPKRLTGMNWFMKLNCQLKRLSISAVLTPPVVVAPNPVAGMTLTKDGSDIKIGWTSPLTGTVRLDIWTTGPHSKGISGKIEHAKFLKYTIPDVAQPIVLVAGATVGRYTIFARIVSITDGQTSTWVSAFFDFT